MIKGAFVLCGSAGLSKDGLLVLFSHVPSDSGVSIRARFEVVTAVCSSDLPLLPLIVLTTLVVGAGCARNFFFPPILSPAWKVETTSVLANEPLLKARFDNILLADSRNC